MSFYFQLGVYVHHSSTFLRLKIRSYRDDVEEHFPSKIRKITHSLDILKGDRHVRSDTTLLYDDFFSPIIL